MIQLARCLLVTSLVFASPLAAQQPGVLRADLMLGASTVSGGIYHYRTGINTDLLVAGRLLRMRGGSVVAGLASTSIHGALNDSCMIHPAGGCAEKGNFTAVTALFGVDRALGRGSLRVLAGPSKFNGTRDDAVGVQGRIGLATDAAWHLAFGFMAHATLLPKYDGVTLVIWGAGFGLTIR